jgi:hypothetical protein
MGKNNTLGGLCCTLSSISRFANAPTRRRMLSPGIESNSSKVESRNLGFRQEGHRSSARSNIAELHVQQIGCPQLNGN